MQAYIEFLIQFGSTRSKLLAFLYRTRSICGWTLLSPDVTDPVLIHKSRSTNHSTNSYG